MSGHTAILGTNIGKGMTQFKLGNVQPETECKVILKLAFEGQVTKENAIFIKFPIDVYNTSGSNDCLDVNAANFSFQLQRDSEKIEKVTFNVKNAKFDDVTKIFSINDKIENNKNEKSIILTFNTKDIFQSSCYISPIDSVNYDGCAISISPNLPSNENTNSEFIFVVDCSYSMQGNSIKKASECLELFIKSLPVDCFFNVIRFGTNYEKLFETSILYDDQASEKAVTVAQNLSANLGCTDIYSPLESIFNENCIHGQRQIFILTDGEVDNVDRVISLISSNSNENRCFTIGIGSGCDAGLVELMASVSGGISDFVQEGDSISEKVIRQLQSSFQPSVTSLEIHIEGENNDSFECSPYPLPNINANGSTVVFLRQKKRENSFKGGFMITGNFGNESVEIPIEDIHRLVNVEEDKFGCCGGKNIGKAIIPLFSFSNLKKLERKHNISDEDKKKAIELSISSGVLCKYTGYVGMTEIPVTRNSHDDDRCYFRPPQHNHRYFLFQYWSWDSSDDMYGHTAHRYSSPSSINKSPSDSSAQPAYQPKYELLSLTRYQKANGFWEDLEAVKSITGIEIDHIDEINLSDTEIETRCVATILAIAALKTSFSNERDSWVLIEQKALVWLKKTLPDVNIEHAISKIQLKV